MLQITREKPISYDLSPEKPPFELVPHPEAPLFATPDGPTFLQDVIKELQSPNFELDYQNAVILRQCCLVSLWFFLKFVAGYANPFDRLNDDLHLAMCNYRQSLLEPGCRGAMFIPRGHYKSTIVTEGGIAWELLRQPDLRVRITNAIAEKAQDFMKSIKAIFDSNDFVKALFPEYVPRANAPGWNDTIITLPNRSKKYREASVETGGIGGASEGHHYDLHVVDDMIGLATLNANRQSNAVMLGTENWFWASEKPLLVSMRNSRVIVVGTRYAVDDVYDSILRKSYKFEGYPLRNFEPNPEGSWRVYYRKGIEDGRVIFPEEFTAEAYKEMSVNDYWTYVTQYLNDPQEAGLAELISYEALPAGIEYDDGRDDYVLELGADNFVQLSDCDVLQAVDPAATERYVSAKTSRSVSLLAATTPKDDIVVFALRAGYVQPTAMFDWMFDNAKRYGRWLRSTFLEANAGFKVLGSVLHEEERRRGVLLKLRPFAAMGDKDARIRSTLQPLLDGRRLYCVEAFMPMLNEELRSFPQSRKKDILDALAIAVSNRYTPEDEEAREKRVRAEQRWRNRTHNVCGY